ncbi:hypothetical protein HYT26_00220 [Candidatus Pacearchaeota archaeon]|nr:hypothetical protein [Candidatus Pacearchaeota archaeon]
MENAGLLKLSFMVSIAGILILLFLSEIMQPGLTEISSISKSMLEKSVSIRGVAVSEKNLGNFKIIELCDRLSMCIPVTLSGKKNLTDSLSGKEFVVAGRIAEYKNELQIEADKIIEVDK